MSVKPIPTPENTNYFKQLPTLIMDEDSHDYEKLLSIFNELKENCSNKQIIDPSQSSVQAVSIYLD